MSRTPAGLAIRSPLPRQDHRQQVQGRPLGAAEKPGDLTEEQAETLVGLRKSGGALWRACQLKETLRAVFAGDLASPAVMEDNAGGEDRQARPGKIPGRR